MEPSKQANLTNILLAIIIGLLICIFIYLVSEHKSQTPFMFDQYNNPLDIGSQSASPLEQ